MGAKKNVPGFGGDLQEKKALLLKKLQDQGFSSRIVQAFANVPREEFVPPALKDQAYEDTPLPIGWGQTISQPSTIAFMLSLLQPRVDAHVLEIGCGSGYVLALLHELVPQGSIVGVERIGSLAKLAEERTKKMGNVCVVHDDASKGVDGMFDNILVSAAFDAVPLHLLASVREGGNVVSPVRDAIVRLTKQEEGKWEQEVFRGFAFVPILPGKR
ncbi:methyltransferase domain-containing protein [Candidatus Woesearchaeota archaeon]|nr:MAG: methyltransferase domain-containing protein [Candidatus Woesearchaeota archaeon]